jgi:hypothetical protein
MNDNLNDYLKDLKIELSQKEVENLGWNHSKWSINTWTLEVLLFAFFVSNGIYLFFLDDLQYGSVL